MNLHRFNHSYQRVVHAFLIYIAALFGPVLVISGNDLEYKKNLIVGVLLIVYLFYHLVKCYPHRNVVVKSEKIAYIVVPICILPVGLLFAIARLS